jgi:hypothetical protein
MKGFHVVLDAADYSATGYLSGPVPSHAVGNDIEAHLVVGIERILVIVSLLTDIGKPS